MANERIIGIDFGTSTSVIRVKSYTPEGDTVNGRLDTKSVIFNNGSTTVPTVIQKIKGIEYFGYDAEVQRNNAEEFRSFKLDLQSDDAEKRELAKGLTKEYFKYLYKEYSSQSNGGHLGSIDEKEKTLVSYPVKWSEETRAFMLEAAIEAGFKNVEGMDEAQAAICAVTVQCENLLKRKKYLINGKTSNILLIDMGAGTTDLVLCRFTPGDKPQNDIISVWPKKGATLFGGTEVDEILRQYIYTKVPEEFRVMIEDVSLDIYKSWKETTVSPELDNDESIEDCVAISNILKYVGGEMNKFNLNCVGFESFAASYLSEFPNLINDCLDDAGMDGSDIDLVILTGGHSQWYFVKEFLTGKMTSFRSVNLPKIKNASERIITAARPHETVALGLVYSKVFNVPNNAEHREQDGTTDSLIYEGVSYMYGRNNHMKDIERAERIFLEAANKGNSKASFFLGELNREQKKYVKSIRWYKDAGKKGDFRAFQELGFMCLDGLGIEKNTLTAAKLFSKSVEIGKAKAEYTLGIRYTIRKNYDQAVYWFAEASKDNYADAYYYLGYYYEKGLGVKADRNKAIYLYELALKNGSRYSDAIKEALLQLK